MLWRSFLHEGSEASNAGPETFGYFEASMVLWSGRRQICNDPSGLILHPVRSVLIVIGGNLNVARDRNRLGHPKRYKPATTTRQSSTGSWQRNRNEMR